MADTTTDPTLDALKRRLYPDGYYPGDVAPSDVLAGVPLAGDTPGTMNALSDPTATTPAPTPATTTPNPVANPAPDPFASSLQGNMNTDYDPTYENLMAQITGQQNQVSSQYDQAVQKLRTAFQAPRQQAQQSWEDQLQQLQGQMAQQGILRSSNNLEGQGRLNTSYLNTVGQLDLSQQQQQEALDRQRADYLQQLLQQGVQGEGAHAAFLSQRAEARALQQAQTQAAADAAARQQQYNANQTAQQQQAASDYADTVARQQYMTPGANNYTTGQTVNPATGEFITGAQFDPLYGWLDLTNMGGIYTGGGGAGVGIDLNNFGGSYLGYAGTTPDPEGERGAHGDFSGGQISINPDLSYTITNSRGEKYTFSPQQAYDPVIKRRLGL